MSEPNVILPQPSLPSKAKFAPLTQGCLWKTSAREPSSLIRRFGERKSASACLEFFGLLALSLASVGLYAFMAYSVNQRRREIGVRMALGASEGSVLLLVLRQGMTVVLSGVALGMGLAVLLGRALSHFLYGVTGSDLLSLGAASLTLLVVAFVACFLPARSASHVDPLVALHES